MPMIVNLQMLQIVIQEHCTVSVERYVQGRESNNKSDVRGYALGSPVLLPGRALILGQKCLSSSKIY